MLGTLDDIRVRTRAGRRTRAARNFAQRVRHLYVSRPCDNLLNSATDSTTGDEAVLECTQGNYCCDTNRPTIGCCDTGGTLFSLQDADGQLPFNPANGGAPSSTAAPADTSEPSNSAPPLPTPTAPTAASSTQAPAPSTASSSSSPAALSTSVPSNSPGSEASQGGQQSQSPTSLSTLSASFTTTLRGQTLDPNTRTSQDPSVIIVTSTITNSVGSSTILTTAVPASSTNVPVAAPTPQPHKSNILGPAIGVPVGVVVLALIIAFFLWRYRRSKQRGRAEDDPTRYNYDRKGDFGPPSIAVPGSLVVRQGHSQPGLGDNGIDTDAITGGGATGQSQYRGVPTTVQRMPKQSHLSPPLGGVPVSLSHSELSGSMPITPPPPHYNEIDGREKAAERQAIQYELPGN